MVMKVVVLGLIGLLGSCGKPAAEKAAAPMEVSPMFGNLEMKGDKGELTLTLDQAPGKPEPAFLGILVNSTPSGLGACYVIADVATGKMRLVNDSGSGAQELETKASVGNQQCELKAAGTRLERSAGKLDVHFGVTFRKDFAGKKQLFGIAMDGNGAGKGLEPGGTFVVSK